MTFFDAEMVEMIILAKPELFTPTESEITLYKNEAFGQVPYKKKVTGSKAEDILNTASAIEMKYGKERAKKYIKTVLKKGV